MLALFPTIESYIFDYSPFALFQFENFYHVNFSGRKLTWLHHLCHGELKLTYLKKPYIITMQTYQMAILLLFEGVDMMTSKEIQVRNMHSSAIERLQLIWFDNFTGHTWAEQWNVSKAHSKFNRGKTITVQHRTIGRCYRNPFEFRLLEQTHEIQNISRIATRNTARGWAHNERSRWRSKTIFAGGHRTHHEI